MIIQTKENIKNCQLDINGGFLYFAIKQNLVFKIKLSQEQEKSIIKQTKNNGNFEKILEIIDCPF